MIAFTKYLLTPIVDNLEEISITEEKISDTQSNLIIKAPKSQMGHLIGKGGKTITAIRQLVKIKGQLTDHQTFVKLEEFPEAN